MRGEDDEMELHRAAGRPAPTATARNGREARCHPRPGPKQALAAGQRHAPVEGVQGALRAWLYVVV